ncbi:alpha-ketoacid dehydrogenase subunit beta [Chloroflexota bacterium]
MPKTMSYNMAGLETIKEEMRRDPNIFILGPTLLDDLKDEFGSQRIVSTGISEEAACAAGIGAAIVGTRPIVDLTWSPFLIDAAGQIINQAAIWRFKLGNTVDIPVIFRQGYGLYNYGGGVQHSQCFHNLFANAPGLYVAVPSTPIDLVGLWRTALREAKNPTMIWESLGCALTGLEGPVPEEDFTVPFGKGEVKREGKHVTIAAVGYMVHLALRAAEQLAQEGIEAEVWDPRTLTPFDREGLIASVKKTGSMVTVDLAPKSFGTTAEFMATIAESSIVPSPPMARVASVDVPIGYNQTLESYAQPDKDKIITAVRNVLSRKR